jgi:hypothetical protein
MKIAIYTCNFGNYRNEFNNYFDTKFDEKIDYYLFTDKKVNEKDILKLKHFTICYIYFCKTKINQVCL